jgi:hypothetical protein
VYGVLRFEPDRYRFIKESHETNVRSYFAGRPDKLLVFDVSQGDGWQQLCAFLGRPVPDESFPHLNRALVAPYPHRTTPSVLGSAVHRVRQWASRSRPR